MGLGNPTQRNPGSAFQIGDIYFVVPLFFFWGGGGGGCEPLYVRDPEGSQIETQRTTMETLGVSTIT